MRFFVRDSTLFIKMRVQASPFFLLLMIYATYFTLALEISTQRNEHLQRCKIELNLTDSELKDIEKSDTRREVRSCLSACILQKEGVINANGTFNKINAINTMNPGVSKENAHKAVDNCQHEVSDNVCETAELIQKCFTAYKVL